MGGNNRLGNKSCSRVRKTRTRARVCVTEEWRGGRARQSGSWVAYGQAKATGPSGVPVLHEGTSPSIAPAPQQGRVDGRNPARMEKGDAPSLAATVDRDEAFAGPPAAVPTQSSDLSARSAFDSTLALAMKACASSSYIADACWLGSLRHPLRNVRSAMVHLCRSSDLVPCVRFRRGISYAMVT